MAFMCDIERVFLQVQVAPEHRNFLRFLWWEDGDLSKSLTEYRMSVHLFGATSPSGCADLVLKRTAENFEDA